MITPDLPTIRNWLDTANTHNARLSIVVKLWDAQPEDRISLAETYTGNSVLRDTWDDARGELRLELKARVALPTQDVGEAFLDALQALQLEASGAEDVSTREVWVFPTFSGASEVAYRVERSSGMVRHYVLDASLESYADARKTAEQQRFFGVDGYLGHFSSDAEKSVYGTMAQGRPLWLGLSDKDNAGVWKVSSGPKQGQVFWRETSAGVGIYGSGARSSGLPGSGLPGSGSPGSGSPGSSSTGSGSLDSGSPGSGWGDADWEKLWGTNDFPQRVSSGSGFPVALLDGDDAEVSSSEDTKGVRIVHHDLLLSSGGFFAREVRVLKTSSTEGGRSDADTADTAEVAPEKEVLVRKTRASLSRQTRSVDDAEPLRAKLGEDTRINEEGLLTPDDVTLGSWIQSATDYSGTLLLIVRLLDDESGDALFLEAGYDATKVTSVPQWDDTTKELPVNIASGATPADIRNALSFLSVRTDPASADSERKVWLFPTLSGVDSFRYRVDETAGLVRYYLYDDTVRSRADATTAAAGRSLFGKPGYLGMPLSDEGKEIYKSLGSSASNLHLAISKSGSSWRITAGPRTGQDRSFGILEGDLIEDFKVKVMVPEQPVPVGVDRQLFGRAVSCLDDSTATRYRINSEDLRPIVAPDLDARSVTTIFCFRMGH